MEWRGLHVVYCRKARRKGTTIIKMDFREIGWSGMDWIYVAHDRDQRRAFANMVMKLQVP
jgi:hypothetical protein